MTIDFRRLWPEGKEACCLFTFDLDAESSLMDGGHKGPVMLSQGKYGATVGTDLLLELLADKGVKGTWFITGWTCDHYPEQAAKIAAAGHATGAHGYLHENLGQVADRDEEEHIFNRAMAAYERALGQAPTSFRAPYWEFSAHTLDILLARGFRVSSNMMDHFVPYYHAHRGRRTGLLELPVHWIADDAPFYVFPPRKMSAPQEVLAAWRAEFDGLRRRGGLFNLTCHPKYSGRPGRVDALGEFMNYVLADESVWTPTVDELEEYWRRTHPADT